MLERQCLCLCLQIVCLTWCLLIKLGLYAGDTWTVDHFFFQNRQRPLLVCLFLYLTKASVGHVCFWIYQRSLLDMSVFGAIKGLFVTCLFLDPSKASVGHVYFWISQRPLLVMSISGSVKGLCWTCPFLDPSKASVGHVDFWLRQRPLLVMSVFGSVKGLFWSCPFLDLSKASFGHVFLDQRPLLDKSVSG